LGTCAHRPVSPEKREKRGDRRQYVLIKSCY
jgi:hypothetical protein